MAFHLPTSSIHPNILHPIVSIPLDPAYKPLNICSDLKAGGLFAFDPMLPEPILSSTTTDRNAYSRSSAWWPGHRSVVCG
jgi:hypothetical protein